MRLGGVLVGALLVGCASHHWGPSEGPPRLVVRAPRHTNVEELWIARVFLEGQEVLGPACMLVEAQSAPVLRSCFALYTRQLRVAVRFPRSLYMEMARKNPFGRPQPGDTFEPVVPGPLTTPLFDEWGWNGDIEVRISLWRAEPDDRGELEVVGFIAAKTLPVRLSCVDCMV